MCDKTPGFGVFRYKMERAAGLRPAGQTWKDGVLASVRCPQTCWWDGVLSVSTFIGRITCCGPRVPCVYQCHHQRNKSILPQNFCLSSKKIFCPPSIFFQTYKSEQSPRCVDRQPARLSQQRHLCFLGRSVVLLSITSTATRHQIIPRKWTPARSGQHMIQSQHNLLRLTVDLHCRAFFLSAVLAPVMIARVNVRPSEDRNPDRNFLVVPQPDNARKRNPGVNFDPVVFFCNRRTLDQQL